MYAVKTRRIECNIKTKDPVILLVYSVMQETGTVMVARNSSISLEEHWNVKGLLIMEAGLQPGRHRIEGTVDLQLTSEKLLGDWKLSVSYRWHLVICFKSTWGKLDWIISSTDWQDSVSVANFLSVIDVRGLHPSPEFSCKIAIN